jgi:hypothetical protein
MMMILRISINLRPLRVFLLVSLLLITFCGQVSSAKADSALIVENVVSDYIFTKNLHISASLPQAADIKNISLILGPDNQQTRQVQTKVNADNLINVNYDLNSSGFIPFSRIYYWFEAELKDGTISTSASYWFDYLDNRFSWKSSESNLFSIFWVTGDAAYGQKLQQVSRSGLERATLLLPVVPKTPIQIYVYPDESSLQTVLTLDSETWVNGHTILGSNRILVVDNLPAEDLTDLERTIPHEIMHLIEYQVTGTNYQNSPAWLLEGLSTQTELYPNPDRERELTRAIADHSLKPLSELCSGLDQDPSQALIDYAHSSAIVGYIQQNFGNQVFLTLLENASSGMECNNNALTTLGISLQQLDSDWQNSLKARNSLFTSFQLSTVLWIAIPVVLLLTGVIILLRRRKNSSIQEDM